MTRAELDHLLDVPDEGADADGFVAVVEFADGGEELVDAVVFDDDHDGGVHLRPGVGMPMQMADYSISELLMRGILSDCRIQRS